MSQRNVFIKDYEFKVIAFSAYDSLMLAGDLAKIASKVIGKYESNNILSIFNGLNEFETKVLMDVVEKVCSKVLYQDCKIDLNSQKWSGANLSVILHLVWDVITHEYSALLEEAGLGEFMKPGEPEEEESDSKTSTKKQ